MDGKRFQEALSKAIARVTHEDGKVIDPATLPETAWTDDVLIAWALVSAANAGAAQTTTLNAISAMLGGLGIGEQVGDVIERVRTLGDHRDRLRNIAGVAAKEIERLTAQRDAARAGIQKVFQAIEAGDPEIVHEPIVNIRGRDHAPAVRGVRRRRAARDRRGRGAEPAGADRVDPGAERSDRDLVGCARIHHPPAVVTGRASGPRRAPRADRYPMRPRASAPDGRMVRHDRRHRTRADDPATLRRGD